jgi:hypothetical protein
MGFAYGDYPGQVIEFTKEYLDEIKRYNRKEKKAYRKWSKNQLSEINKSIKNNTLSKFNKMILDFQKDK